MTGGADAQASIEIFVPFWGDPQLLWLTVESVRAQSDPEWTLVVVDDCYPDPSVAERFAAESDPRIRYLRNDTNLGITENYERCRSMATADLMMFLGCDDLLRPGFVATARSAYAAHPDAAILQVGVEVIDEHGTVVRPLGDRVKAAIRPRVRQRTELGGEELAVSLLGGNWLYWPSLVFRTSRVQAFGFRENLPIIQDLALVIDMVAAGETLVLEPSVRFSYRRHTESASATSLLRGRRLPDERRYYAEAAEQMRRRGWSRAARSARLRWSSRLHAVSLVPRAAKARAGFGALLRHTLG